MDDDDTPSLESSATVTVMSREGRKRSAIGHEGKVDAWREVHPHRMAYVFAPSHRSNRRFGVGCNGGLHKRSSKCAPLVARLIPPSDDECPMAQAHVLLYDELTTWLRHSRSFTLGVADMTAASVVRHPPPSADRLRLESSAMQLDAAVLVTGINTVDSAVVIQGLKVRFRAEETVYVATLRPVSRKARLRPSADGRTLMRLVSVCASHRLAPHWSRP
jgi:hypothetical protein